MKDTLSSFILRKLPSDIVEFRAAAELLQGFFFFGVFFALCSLALFIHLFFTLLLSLKSRAYKNMPNINRRRGL